MRTENEIWRIVVAQARAGVAVYPGVKVIRAYQPSAQSGGAVPRVVLHRVSSRRYGAQGKLVVSRGGKLFEKEVWRKEDTFQANALADRAADDDGFTARDVLEALGGYLQGQVCLDALRKEGMGILRVQDITETPYQDEGDDWRFSVSLKFTLTYRQEVEREIHKAVRVERKIHRI